MGGHLGGHQYQMGGTCPPVPPPPPPAVTPMTTHTHTQADHEAPKLFPFYLWQLELSEDIDWHCEIRLTNARINRFSDGFSFLLPAYGTLSSSVFSGFLQPFFLQKADLSPLRDQMALFFFYKFSLLHIYITIPHFTYFSIFFFIT